METLPQKRVLLAVDGSDQALEAVRYIGSVVAPAHAEIVLFHVGSGFPQVYWDMGRNPLYDSKKNKVKGWLADNQLVMGEFKEKAFKILSNWGFGPQAIQVKTQTEKTSVLVDIIQESYQGYSAVVVGRTGVSWLKDVFTGSLAYKLVEKIKHIPTVVVSGRPISRKVLLALDDSAAAMRAAHSVGIIAETEDLTVTMCHVIKLPGMFRTSSGKLALTEREEDWLAYTKNKFRPIMCEAAERLMHAGLKREQISCNFICFKGNPIQKIIETALTDGYGTVVVGRRHAASFIQGHFRGRFSDKIIKSMDNIAAWVVN